MKYETVSEAIEALKKLQRTMAAYNHAMGVLYLDATTVAPAILGKAEERPWRLCPRSFMI